MAYNLIITDEMDKLLENCVNYILRKFKNEQAASHLLDEVEKIYDEIEDVTSRGKCKKSYIP